MSVTDRNPDWEHFFRPHDRKCVRCGAPWEKFEDNIISVRCSRENGLWYTRDGLELVADLERGTWSIVVPIEGAS